MVTVKLKEISKSFGEDKIIKSINWEIFKGELMVLVGPSGCGKTTLLRIILGVLDPDNGEIYFNEKLINKISISERNVGFVPQNFGLFPHLNVNENIGYGLKMRNLPRNKIEIITKKIIGMLKLEGLELRTTNQLSWGQRQRVALARALAIEPSLLLLDEPLSSVDWASRKEITDEINRMQKRLRITTVYVTHNINEAFEIGDRIAVMHAGKIEQCDNADGLIKTPKSNFVAAYLKNQKVGNR